MYEPKPLIFSLSRVPLAIKIDILSKLKNLKWLYCDDWFDFTHWFKLDNKERNFGNMIDHLTVNN